MKGYLRCALTLVLVVTAAAFFLAGIAWFAAGWLSASDKLVKSDRILVLAGEPARFLYGADLYRQGYAPEVYVSRPVRSTSFKIFDELQIPFPRFEELYRAVLVKKGVSEQHIHYLGNGSLSTIDEGLAAKQMMAASNSKSLLVVTSPYHVRRVKMIFRDLMPNALITVVATPYEDFPDKWWNDQGTARDVLLEAAKIAFYIFGGRFTSNAPE